jgi:hypothetical protein
MSLAFPTLREGMEPLDQWRNLTEFARSIPEEGEMDPYLALEFWAKDLVERTRHHWDAVVAVTGDEGTGKSTLAMRLAIRSAELAGSTWSPREACYSALDLLGAYRAARKEMGRRKGKPVVADDAIRDLMAGDQMNPEQKAVVKALTLVRETGAILFICAPSIWLIPKQLRARRITLWLHVVRRGLARVHERDRRLNYLPTDALGLAISPRAPHVAWKPYLENSTVWQEYLTSKEERLDLTLAGLERELTVKRAKAEGTDPLTAPLTDTDRLAWQRAQKTAAQRRWRQRVRARKVESGGGGE